jgi:hypothetical protein
LELKKFSNEIWRENKKTEIVFSNFICENIIVCENNVEKCGAVGQVIDGNLIACVLFTCRITKATNTNSEYVIIVAF